MREADHTAAFAKLLPPDIDHTKLSLRRGCKAGVADSYYDGPARDLWVEWKRVTSNPRHLDAEKLLTKAQLDWLKRREQNGRNVAVFVVTPSGIAVFTDMKDLQRTAEQLKGSQLSRRELVAEVTSFLRGEIDALTRHGTDQAAVSADSNQRPSIRTRRQRQNAASACSHRHARGRRVPCFSGRTGSSPRYRQDCDQPPAGGDAGCRPTLH